MGSFLMNASVEGEALEIKDLGKTVAFVYRNFNTHQPNREKVFPKAYATQIINRFNELKKHRNPTLLAEAIAEVRTGRRAGLRKPFNYKTKKYLAALKKVTVRLKKTRKMKSWIEKLNFKESNKEHNRLIKKYKLYIDTTAM